MMISIIWTSFVIEGAISLESANIGSIEIPSASLGDTRIQAASLGDTHITKAILEEALINDIRLEEAVIESVPTVLFTFSFSLPIPPAWNLLKIRVLDCDFIKA